MLSTCIVSDYHKGQLLTKSNLPIIMQSADE